MSSWGQGEADGARPGSRISRRMVVGAMETTAVPIPHASSPSSHKLRKTRLSFALRLRGGRGAFIPSIARSSSPPGPLYSSTATSSNTEKSAGTHVALRASNCATAVLNALSARALPKNSRFAGTASRGCGGAGYSLAVAVALRKGCWPDRVRPRHRRCGSRPQLSWQTPTRSRACGRLAPPPALLNAQRGQAGRLTRFYCNYPISTASTILAGFPLP